MEKEIIRTEIAKKLMKLREARGLSKKEVAARTGISYASYRKYETKVVPPSAKLILLAEFFEVPLDYFTDREEKSPKKDDASEEAMGSLGSLTLKNYDIYQALDEEIGELTEQEELLISIFRSAGEEDKKKIIRYIKNKKKK